MSALLALLKQKQQDMAASRKGRTAKIPDGTSRWRIMPSWRGAGQQFWHDFGQHFVKDSAGKLAAIYMCTDKTFGRPCAVCDAVSTGIKGATDDATMAILQDAKSAPRVLVNALQLDTSDPHKMHILEMPPTVFEQFVAICAEWEEAGETVLGAGGKDIVINRTGTGKNTKYTVQVGAKSTVVPAEVCAKPHNLDEYVAQESSEAAARALNSVRAISGLLPAPSSSAGIPAGAAMLGDDDPYAVASAPPKRPKPVEFEDVPDLKGKPEDAPWEEPAAAPAKPAAAAPAAATSKPAPAAAESTGDEDLDKLLADLGG